MSKSKQLHSYLPIIVILLIVTGPFSYGQFLKKKDKKPIWIEQVPDRPDLLQGIGMAQDTGVPEKDKIRADNAAITQIIHEISTTVNSKLVDYYKEKSNAGDVSILEVYTSMSTHYAKETIKGIKVSDRYFDKKNKLYYSYAYISHEDLEKQFHKKAENVAKLCADYHYYAQQALEQRNIYAALTNYGKALGELFVAQAFLKRKLVRYLENNGRKEMLQVRLESELSSILGQIYFQIVSGSGQKAERNRGLSKPLIGKVIFQSSTVTYPVPNLPVRFRFVNAIGDLSEKVLTNSDGTFSGYVNLIESANSEKGLIRATVHFAELEPFRREIPGMFEYLDQVGISFDFLIDVTASVRIFVKVHEEIDGIIVKNPLTDGALIKSLIQNKFTVVDLLHITSGFSLNDIELAIKYGDDKTIVTVAKDDADYAIVGTVFSESGDALLGGGLVFAHASADLRVIDLQSGRVLASSVQSGVKAAGNNSSKANNKAMKKCGEIVSNNIIEGLIEALK